MNLGDFSKDPRFSPVQLLCRTGGMAGDAQPWLIAAVYVMDAKYPGPVCFHTTRWPPKGTVLLELCLRL